MASTLINDSHLIKFMSTVEFIVCSDIHLIMYYVHMYVIHTYV